MPNITYESCYSLFILLPAKGLQFSHVDILKEAEIPLLGWGGAGFCPSLTQWACQYYY